MSLRLYDTATASVRDFVPLQDGRVGLYLCGATVQSEPHIGHLRSAVAFDQLWRWLEAGHGYDVTFVRNVTDIDDKILAKSAEAGVEWWAWAMRNERAFAAAYDAVGLRRPTYEPRATGHVTEMVELMQRLEERGHAYRAEDGSSDVYFDVRSFEGYGALTHQRLDDMAPAGDADPRGKRDPRDFALWKSVKPDEPATASWPTPFGVGRPGWHLECSAMIRRYLGEEFDIHAGGLDLRFPHHENEQAQSRAAGYGFARYWLHNAWVTTGGEKMSKSLGNSLLVTSILERVRPIDLRYYLGSAHYRSNIEFHESSLEEAASAMGRIEGFMARAGERANARIPSEIASRWSKYESWLARQPKYNPHTVASYRSDLRLFLFWATAQESARTVSDLEALVPAWTNWCLGVGLSDSTIKQRRRVALQFIGDSWNAGRSVDVAEAADGQPWPHRFVEAMNDDLNVSGALAVVHDTVRSGNTALDARADEVVGEDLRKVEGMTSVLGINPDDEPFGGTAGDDDRWAGALEALVHDQIEERARARAAKDWTAADAVRDRLAAAGVELVDAADGTTWQLADPKERG